MLKRFFSANFLIIVIMLVASFLRLYKLSVNPPSLFGDELDLGYQAYSILKTGHDYSGNFMPIHFHSLAEWRTPLYLYSSVPTVAIFGITPLGVRLPAALFGILSVLAMYLFTKELLIYKQPPVNKHYRSLLAAFLMAISPWSLQYSRAGFEVTLLLALLLLGLYLFLKSLSNSKWLWVSILCLVLTPWVYATAKLFTPMLIVFLFIIFRQEILSMKKIDFTKGVFVGLLIGLPIAFSTFFSGGTQRISDISILTDPAMEQVVGAGRDLDQKVGTNPLESKFINNKFVFYSDKFINNYLESFSPNFLFLKGDSNLRQSIGTGQLFMIEIIPFLVGMAFFFVGKDQNIKIKFLMGFWVLAGALPSALTMNGGNHATRLILILPPLIFFVAFGYLSLYKIISQNHKILFLSGVSGLYILSLVFYLHQYYAVYPSISEHWWHYGWSEAINEIKKIDKDYDRVIISMSGEPAWIFFAANYEYSPTLWQNEFPIGHNEKIPGFGEMSHTGKFYFGSPDHDTQIYGLGRVINSRTLYLANASEDGENLILHPDKLPDGLKLVKAIPFISGEPAFYLFAGTAK